MNDLKKRTWAEISLENIKYNYETIRASVPAGTKFLGVVKADAYGHGAVPVAKTLEKAGADYLAVACLDEAVQLREAGIRMPILILGHTPAAYTKTLVENNITQAVTNLEKAKEFSSEAEKLGKQLTVHIKADTGMSRIGFIVSGKSEAESIDGIDQACRLPGLKAEGIFTHFAVSDEEGEENEAYTRLQFGRFTHVIEELGKRGITFAIRHCANTGATLNYHDMTLDMVRPGLLLYGYGDSANKLGLKPCMKLVTRIATVKTYEPGTTVSYGRHFETGRETRMGVLFLGYADGLHRTLSNKAEFYAGGKFVPQRGNICMDMCMVDLTDAPETKEGDEVEIFGDKVSLDKLAGIAGTISYELLCAVSKRVPRVYD